MAATMLSNYYSSQLQVHNWMLAQMANYPPPPQSDHNGYNLYPPPTGPQQLLDSSQQGQPQYSSLDQPIFPKVELANQVHSPSSQQIQSLAQELSQHAAYEEQQRHHLQHAVHLQQSNSGTSHPTNVATNPPTHPATPDHAPQKNNRLRKACDSCSIRKVKCDEAGPPCKACATLDIPCTFQRPSRRRGPPNRHAEAIKRRRLEEAGSPGLSGTSSPTSPTHAAQALAALSGHSSVPISAEAICPAETLDLLIDDFFTYLYPLCPFPHEPSFREAWKRREDLTNKSFLALLASMIGALVASFPRKPRLHLKAQRRDDNFPNHMLLVERCQNVCAAARGPGYLDSNTLNVYDAATSHFLALIGIYNSRWRTGRLYFGECLTILRTFNLHKPPGQTFTQLGSLPMAAGFRYGGIEPGSENAPDHITVEMGRRIFWAMFITVRKMEQLNANFSELVIPPPTHSASYPPLPTEVDDFCIYPGYIEQQPEGLLPIISGFNANARVYSSYHDLARSDLASDTDTSLDMINKERNLRESLRRCKADLDNIPKELTVNTGAGLDMLSQQNGFYPGLNVQPHLGRDPASSLMSPESRPQLEMSPEDRRRLQYELQKANIYVSSLATRSYIVDKYLSLFDAYRKLNSQDSSSPTGLPDADVFAAGKNGAASTASTSHDDAIESEMRDESQTLTKELLAAISSIDQVNMEPNADAFATHIRTAASMLVEKADARKSPLAIEAQDDLRGFLDVLWMLEGVSAERNDDGSNKVFLFANEDAQRQAWADLQRYQSKLAQLSSSLNLS